jgi:hypothetical protein
MLLTVLMTYAQSSEKAIADTTVTQIQQIPDSAKLTLLKVYEDTKAGLIGLAGALKTTAEHVYVVLVKQQVVYSISYLLFDIMLFIVSIYFLSCFKNNYKRTQIKTDSWYNDDIEDHFGLVGMLVFGIIFGIILIVSIAFNGTDIVTGFINPEYGAIKDIINFIN